MTAQSDSFQPAREQDAWGVLRGFKYQIDLTLIRWFALTDGQLLELERGEDIDHVGRALAEGDDDEFLRTLEQVKVRAKRITLRSPETIEAIANAFEHRVANPDKNMRFCFTTNAKVGRERLKPFPDGKRGIELWEEIRLGQLSDVQSQDAIDAFSDFLKSVKMPQRIGEQTWAAFGAFVSSGANLEQFIRAFEWSCGNSNPDELVVDVKRRIQVIVADSEMGNIDGTYSRLFLFVLRLLTQSGTKQLTKTLLHEQLAAGVIGEIDQQAISRLDGRLSALEQRVAQVSRAVQDLSTEVATLGKKYGATVGSVEQVGIVNLSAPPLAEKLSLREETVSVLAETLDKIDWLAVRGSCDTGKTHLISLVAERRSTSKWIRLNYEMPLERAVAVLQGVLRQVSGTVATGTNPRLYAQVCRSIGAGASLLIDDLPNLHNDDELTDSLRLLADACHAEKVAIISTSRFQLPSKLTIGLGDARLHEIQVPAFTVADASEILAAYGAPSAVLASQNVTFINGVASGNPLLLALAARYLAERNWALDNDNLDGLLSGDHTSGIADEVIARICKALADPQRDLLYRMSLTKQAIKDETVIELAEVQPVIARPRECLSALLGAWVQRQDSSKVVVSPMLDQVGKDTVQSPTFEECHFILGRSITREQMDPWDAHIAMGHYISAKAFNNAGILYLGMLDQAKRHKNSPAIQVLLMPWSSVPLPVEMHLSIRLMIRAMQFWIFPRYKISDSFGLTELDELMLQARVDDAGTAYHVASLAMLFLASRDFTRALKYFSIGAKLIENSTGRAESSPAIHRENPADLLWTPITFIETREHLEQWLGAFDALSADYKQHAMEAEDSHLGCIVLADRLMLAESYRPESDRDWDAVIASLERLRDWADGHKWEYLASCALKSEVNLRSEYLKEQAPGLEKVKAFIDDDSRSDQAKALVSAMYGKMLAGSGRIVEAVPWLDRGMSSPPAVKGHDYLMTLLAAAKCYADRQQRAIEISREAVEVVRAMPVVSEPTAFKAFGELTIAILGKPPTPESAREAFSTWSEAAERILVGRDRNDEWKETFLIFGHIHGLMGHLILMGEMPATASDGSPYYMVPQGFCSTSHPDRLTLYHDESIPGTMWYQSRMARALGDEQGANLWLERAANEIEGMPLTHVTASVRNEMIPTLLESGQYLEALDAGLRFNEAGAAIWELVGKGELLEAIPHGTPLDSLVSRMSSEGRKTADRFTQVTFTIPSLLYIARWAIWDRERANEAATQIASLCREVAPAAGDSKYWLGAADVFDAIAVNANVNEFFKIAHSYDKTTHQEVRIIGYLAISLTDDLQQAYGAQLACIELLTTWYAPDTITYQRLLLPFFQDYWTSRFDAMRFRFRSHAVVESELKTAATQPEGDRVRCILKAVRPGFQVKGLESAETWLQNASAS